MREALDLARQGQPRNLFNYLTLAAKAETDFGVRPRGLALYVEAADADNAAALLKQGLSLLASWSI